MSSDSTQTQNEKESNTNKLNFEFIPMDLEKDIEEALNEPLPDVSIGEFTDDDSVLIEEVQNESSGIENLKDSFISSPPASRFTPKICTNNQTSIPRVEYSQKIIKPTRDSNDSFDFGFTRLNIQTPVKHIKSGSESFLNSQPLVKRHMMGSTQFNTLYNTRTPDVKSNILPFTPRLPENNFKTPFKSSLVEPRSISKKPLLQMTREEFPKIIVNGIAYINLKVLGRGGSSEVFQCFDITSKENRAIKCVSLDSSPSSLGYLKEIELLKRLQNCDRIIRIYDYEHLIYEKKLMVVLEVGSADMSQILKNLSKHNSNCPSYLIQFYWMEMLYAVQQIHNHKIIHSDLKPANFLLVDGRLKLIDFGISSCLQNDSTSVMKTVSEGSWNYISPEALNPITSTNMSSPTYGKTAYKINFKADVWSLGCILYQLIYRKTPFQHITNPMKKLVAIASSSANIEYPPVDNVPEKFLKTVRKCLVFNRDLRPTVNELISDFEEFFNH